MYRVQYTTQGIAIRHKRYCTSAVIFFIFHFSSFLFPLQLGRGLLISLECRILGITGVIINNNYESGSNRTVESCRGSRVDIGLQDNFQDRGAILAYHGISCWVERHYTQRPLVFSLPKLLIRVVVINLHWNDVQVPIQLLFYNAFSPETNSITLPNCLLTSSRSTS